MRFFKDFLKRNLLTVHEVGARLGVHILPIHYYSPVPNILELRRTRDLWAHKSDLPGISINLEEQCEMLRRVCLPYQSEYEGNKTYLEGVANHFGPGFGYIEAQALHAAVRHFKPRRIIEVGSGVSTYCMLKAVELNYERAHITCIEPYPSPRLKNISGVELFEHPVQCASFDLFEKLRANDLLFIDSSHAVKPGGDVNFLVLEVLPRLRPGVVVHFHDIYLPYDYPRDALKTFIHGMETSLVRAYLIWNERMQILFCLSHLHYERQEVLLEVFPEYKRQGGEDGLVPDSFKPFAASHEHFPSSLYLQTQ